MKHRILENGTLLEQLEQITSPEITNALPLSQGREGWGDSRLSPAPTNCDLLEQLEQVTSPEIINALPLGQGREVWGDSRLSPAPTNRDLPTRKEFPKSTFLTTKKCPRPKETSTGEILCGTVPTSKKGPTTQEKMLSQESICGTVQTNDYYELQGHKEALSKIEDFMKQEDIQEAQRLEQYRTVLIEKKVKS